MGLFNLPAAAVDWGDRLVAEVLPLSVRIAMWAVLAGLLSMELYRLLSPQRRIADIRQRLQAAQREMADYDGPAEGVWPVMSRVLSLALRRIFLVFPATLVAALPVLAVIFWLDTSHAYRLPDPGEEVSVRVSDPRYSAALLRDKLDGPARAVVADPEGRPVAEVPVEKPVPVIHKHRLWNLLLGNPAGYLPDDAPVDGISIDLPRIELFAAGPTWLRGWEPLFFSTLFLAALALKLLRRIE